MPPLYQQSLYNRITRTLCGLSTEAVLRLEESRAAMRDIGDIWRPECTPVAHNVFGYLAREMMTDLEMHMSENIFKYQEKVLKVLFDEHEVPKAVRSKIVYLLNRFSAQTKIELVERLQNQQDFGLQPILQHQRAANNDNDDDDDETDDDENAQNEQVLVQSALDWSANPDIAPTLMIHRRFVKDIMEQFFEPNAPKMQRISRRTVNNPRQGGLSGRRPTCATRLSQVTRRRRRTVVYAFTPSCIASTLKHHEKQDVILEYMRYLCSQLGSFDAGCSLLR